MKWVMVSVKLTGQSLIQWQHQSTATESLREKVLSVNELYFNTFHLIGIGLWTDKLTCMLCHRRFSQTVYSALCTDHPIKTIQYVHIQINQYVTVTAVATWRNQEREERCDVEGKTESGSKWLDSLDLNSPDPTQIQALCNMSMWWAGPHLYWRRLN